MALIEVTPNAPVTGVSDSVTLTAADTQGLVTMQSIDFYPDQIGQDTRSQDSGAVARQHAPTSLGQGPEWLNHMAHDVGFLASRS